MILGSDLYVYEDEAARLLGERAKHPHNFQLSIVSLKRGELQQQADIEAWARKSFGMIVKREQCLQMNQWIEAGMPDTGP